MQIVKQLLCLFSLMFCLNASVYAINTDNLNEEQIAQLALQAAQMKAAAKAEAVKGIPNALVVSDNAATISKQWAGVGKELASGIVATAKELGVAANEFANTPLGKLATYMIVWNYMGHDMLRIGLGFIMMFLGLPVIWKVWKELITFKAEYETVSRWPAKLGRTKRVLKEWQRTTGEPYFFCSFFCAVAAIGLFFISANVILH